MASYSQTRSDLMFRLAAPVRHLPTIKLPHKYILSSLFLIATGLSIPLLIIIAVLPASLLLGLLGMGILGLGVVTFLYFLGEIL